MGMYTELYLAVKLINPPDVVVDMIMERNHPAISGHPISCFVGSGVFDFSPGCGEGVWDLTCKTTLKNYDDDIADFLETIAKCASVGHAGHTRHETSDAPYLIYFDDQHNVHLIGCAAPDLYPWPLTVAEKAQLVSPDNGSDLCNSSGVSEQ